MILNKKFINIFNNIKPNVVINKNHNFQDL